MDFNKSLKENINGEIFVAAHRGVSGGNIPCNTLAAYNIALLQGADIVEIDVTKSLDGKLYVFHPGMEPHHLGKRRYISASKSKTVEKMRFTNQDDVPTRYPISTLDEVFRFLKGKCYINVDKFGENIKEISEAIYRNGVEKQVIVKTGPDEKLFSQIEKYASDLAYMVIIKKDNGVCDELMKRNINFVGAEVIFKTDESELVSDKFIDKMHENGLLLWGNSIIYNEKDVISANHTDDIALTEDPEKGWGYFRDKKFDIIQTDWCFMLKNYLKSGRISAIAEEIK